MLGLIGLVGAALVAGAPAPAGAAVTYDYTVSTSTLALAPGQTGTVNVFIRETVTGGESSRLVAENGLSQAQVTVQRGTLAGLTEPAGITGFTRNTAGFGGSPFDASNLPGTVDVTQFVSLGATSGPTGASTGGVVHLLALSVQAGNTVGEVTTFDVRDNPSFDETLTFANTKLDGLLQPTSFTVTVVPVPEPGALGLIGGAFGLALLRRRRTTR
jgi:hypothetical protein